MNLLYVIYTYNRPNILQACLESLFNQNSLRPDKILFLDDGSNRQLKLALINQQSSAPLPIDVFSVYPNIGYGAIAEFAFRLVEVYDPKYVFFIESDYVFAQHGLDVVMDIFEKNPFGQHAVGFSGYDNPDFHTDKPHTEFPALMIKDCGEDNLNRSIMYKTFIIETAFGPKTLEFVSNSCGTMYLRWDMISQYKREFPIEYEQWIQGSVLKKEACRKPLNDGMMSHGVSWLWNKWALKHNIDRNTYAALLNVRPSIANHINGGGINGNIIPEGQTFVSSPTWKSKYE